MRRTGGDETYTRSLAAGCNLLRRDGLRGLSFRRIAESVGVSTGAVQFHFHTHDELARAVVGAWADGISRALVAAAGDARGLRRTWRLCEGWLSAAAGGIHVVLEAIPVDEDRSKHPSARAAVVENLRRWISETRRSLRQAQLQRELHSDADIGAAAVEIHQLLWSQTWTAAVHGREAAKRIILRGVRQRLAATAIDPTSALPPYPETAAAPVLNDPEELIDLSQPDQGVPNWKLLLDRSDPLYYAFERHQIMGDPRDFVRPPEVIQDDIDRAEEFKRKHPEVA